MDVKKRARTKTYFENLDGLRFFCFLSVFFFHSFISENAGVNASGVYQFVKTGLFGNGNLGVNFFFVLSGFLITYLLIKEKRSTKKINIPHFWTRRILRIWPMYYAIVFLGFIVFPFAKHLMGGVPNETANPWYYIGFISNFDLINNFDLATHKVILPDSQGLGVLWSVAIEEQFYFAWPIILSFFPVKRYWIPFSIIIAGSLAFRAMNDVPHLHELHTLSCIGDMTIGAFGAWLILESSRFKSKIERLSKTAILFAYLGFVLIYLFRTDLLLFSHMTRVIERPLLAIIMLIIILEQCYARNSFYKMSKLKFPTRLGLVTYGLYCIHFIVISATTAITNLAGLNKHVWQVLFLEPAVSLGLTIAISLWSYKYFESPFLKLKTKFS